VISEKERRLTAYHEGGHAVCAHVLEEVSPVHQVTIVPRGRAGAPTFISNSLSEYLIVQKVKEKRIQEGYFEDITGTNKSIANSI
ncbi:hypothetical protein ACTPD5_22100, partial [Clostridioides difficile]